MTQDEQRAVRQRIEAALAEYQSRAWAQSTNVQVTFGNETDECVRRVLGETPLDGALAAVLAKHGWRAYLRQTCWREGGGQRVTLDFLLVKLPPPLCATCGALEHEGFCRYDDVQAKLRKEQEARDAPLRFALLEID